jgi:hypothetical protein
MSQIKLKTEQIQKVNTQNKCKIVREQDRLYGAIKVVDRCHL